MQFYYHSPHDVLDVSNNGFPIADNAVKIVRVGALTTYTTPEARTLSIPQRKCRYPDENNLRISPVYTFNFCQMECRMRIARQRCDCIPHFYRKTGKSQHVSDQGKSRVPLASINFMPSSTPRKLSHRWCDCWGSRFPDFLLQFYSPSGHCNRCQFLFAFSQSQRAPISLVMSVRPSVRPSASPSFHMFICPHVSVPLPPEGFPWNLILRTYLKISRANPKFDKIWHKFHFAWKLKYVLLLPTALNRQKNEIGIRLLGQPRRCKTLPDRTSFTSYVHWLSIEWRYQLLKSHNVGDR